MTCVELQQSLAETEDGSSAAQRAHLRSCSSCTALVEELTLIISSAPELGEADEPSPRVWNSIEIALRQEGLIRRQQANRPTIASFATRWGWARWMAPAAAALLILVGIYVNQRSSSRQMVRNNVAPVSTPDVALAGLNAGLNDNELLQAVSDQAPVAQEQYQDNLRRVNEYIQDAKMNVESSPDDEEARRSLMDAYQEKAMLFEMAMDHSSP
jgi:hypothetical protein